MLTEYVIGWSSNRSLLSKTYSTNHCHQLLQTCSHQLIWMNTVKSNSLCCEKTCFSSLSCPICVSVLMFEIKRKVVFLSKGGLTLFSSDILSCLSSSLKHILEFKSLFFIQKLCRKRFRIKTRYGHHSFSSCSSSWIWMWCRNEKKKDENRKTKSQKSWPWVASKKKPLMSKNFSRLNIQEHHHKLKLNCLSTKINQLLELDKILKSSQYKKTRTMLKGLNEIEKRMDWVVRFSYLRNTQDCTCSNQSKTCSHIMQCEREHSFSLKRSSHFFSSKELCLSKFFCFFDPLGETFPLFLWKSSNRIDSLRISFQKTFLFLSLGGVEPTTNELKARCSSN